MHAGSPSTRSTPPARWRHAALPRCAAAPALCAALALGCSSSSPSGGGGAGGAASSTSASTTATSGTGGAASSSSATSASSSSGGVAGPGEIVVTIDGVVQTFTGAATTRTNSSTAVTGGAKPNGENIGLNTTNFQGLGPGTYPCGQGTAYGAIVYVVPATGGFSVKMNDTCVITITEMTTMGNPVKGTFSGSTADGMHTMTDGSFDTVLTN